MLSYPLIGHLDIRAITKSVYDGNALNNICHIAFFFISKTQALAKSIANVNFSISLYFKGPSPSNGKLSDFSFYIDTQKSAHRKFKK